MEEQVFPVLLENVADDPAKVDVMSFGLEPFLLKQSIHIVLFSFEVLDTDTSGSPHGSSSSNFSSFSVWRRQREYCSSSLIAAHTYNDAAQVLLRQTPRAGRSRTIPSSPKKSTPHPWHLCCCTPAQTLQ